MIVFIALLSSSHGFVYRGKCTQATDVSWRLKHGLNMVDDADELLYKPVSNQGERGKYLPYYGVCGIHTYIHV